MTDEFHMQLTNMAEEVRSWVRGQGNASGYEPSCIRPYDDSRDHSKRILLIDIGGTHTRVALQMGSVANRKFKLVLDESNLTLVSAQQSSELPLRRFARTLAQCAVPRIPDAVDGLGLIWSNQFRARRISEGSLTGVTGKISGVASGSYLKGEWFSENISDDLEFGEFFCRAFTDNGMKLAVFVVANDTVATLNAEPKSAGAIVAATGANAAAINAEGEIVNTELGGLFKVAPRYLLQDEREFFGDVACVLEQIVGGAFLPRIIEARGRKLGSKSDRVARYFEKKGSLASMHSVAALLADRETPCELIEVCGETLKRAGALASLLVAGALALARPGTECSVVLDSSLARVFPDFRSALVNASAEIEPSAKLVLKEPIAMPEGGEISVPTQGLGLSVLAEYR